MKFVAYPHSRIIGEMRSRGGGGGSNSLTHPVFAQIIQNDKEFSKRRRTSGGPSFCVITSVSVTVCILLLLLLWLGPSLYVAYRNVRAPDHSSEDFFTDAQPGASKGTRQRQVRFPSLLSTLPESAQHLIELSIIVPAYNEELRIRAGLDEMIAFLSSSASEEAGLTDSWEIIVADDGSKDATASVLLHEYVEKYGSDKVRLLKMHANGGKGAAVRKAMHRARGRMLLMCDADGATQFSDVVRLLSALKKSTDDGEVRPLGMAVGSRAHMDLERAEKDSPTGSTVAKVQRGPVRRFLMGGFHTYMSLLLGQCTGSIRDTQCGFKLFTREAAKKIFPAQHIERWAFDVELIYLACSLGIQVSEVPVTWHEVGGSKVSLVSASLQMARDVLVIRMSYLFGWWSSTDGGGKPRGTIIPEKVREKIGTAAKKIATTVLTAREKVREGIKTGLEKTGLKLGGHEGQESHLRGGKD